MTGHRHVHDKMGSVYALKTDLDAWAPRRSLALVAEPDVESVTNTSARRLRSPHHGVAGGALGSRPQPARF